MNETGEQGLVEPALTCPHIDRAIASGELSDEVKAELDTIRDINSQLRYGTWHLKLRAEAAEAEIARLTAPLEGARVSAEELAHQRARAERYHPLTVHVNPETLCDIIDSLHHATAQVRLAREDATKDTEIGIAAFDETLRLAAAGTWPPQPISSPLCYAHLASMRIRIGDGSNFTPFKIGKWLGWAQAAVVGVGIATLDDMKALNATAQAAIRNRETDNG